MNRTLIALALALPLFAGTRARAERIDGVAAVVNGDVILLSELEERAGPQLPPADATGADKDHRHRMLERAAEDAVTDKLLEKEAEADGLIPSKAEVDNAVEDVRKANNIDEPTLEKALLAQGLTMDRYREMLKAQLTKMKVVEYKVKSRISVSDDDVKARYAKMAGEVKGKTEVKARDIFLPKGDDPAGTRARVEAARQRILHGESFAKVAEQLGGPLASSGGDLGWFSEGMMLPELEKVAFSLKKGQVSEVFDAGGGWHVMTVEDVREKDGAKPLTEARDEIRQQIVAEKMQKATEEYVADLRRSADVELRVP